ncbi:MAG TPA: CHRD domain-containing protein [Gaiellaceae bacterium]|nr:CHRD domain-containing protein [Gaiellaceae bacterium]
MRSKRWAAAVVAATALAAVPAATAGMMHPTLGASLSGMGEHGIVNLQAHAKGHELCWTFDLHVMHVLGATVRDKGGMVVARLGHMYRAKGCAMLSKSSLALIESKPGHYWVWVATKGHPGELRGQLHAGMAHM